MDATIIKLQQTLTRLYAQLSHHAKQRDQYKTMMLRESSRVEQLEALVLDTQSAIALRGGC